MIIRFVSPCHLKETEALAMLIEKRICLLLDQSVVERIEQVIFTNDNLTDKPISVIAEGLSFNKHGGKVSVYVTYDILFSMLRPGKGQQYFDEGILRIAHV